MTPIDTLIKQISRLPGLGPRSARRIVLQLLKDKEQKLDPLVQSLKRAQDSVRTCIQCGNLDLCDPCAICSDRERDIRLLCVVEDVDDLWAFERIGFFRGYYHVLGGVLSALDGVGPDQLRLQSFQERVKRDDVHEVVLALNATIDGQTTANYVHKTLKEHVNLKVTHLSYGVPIGGELDYLDEGTIQTAFQGRLTFENRR